MVAKRKQSRAMREADIYGGDPRLLPVYSVGEVAHHLRLHPSTVRSWVQARGGLIVPADGKGALLSFQNLTEVHVMSLLRTYEISAQKIRRAAEYLRQRLDTEHPLAEVQITTDHRELFTDVFGTLVAVTGKQPGQAAIEPVLARYLERIEREHGQLARLYPLIHGDARPVVIDPRRKSGAPYLVELGVETHALASRYRSGETAKAIAADYDTSPELILQALRYERAA